jgi:hypothetical protein
MINVTNKRKRACLTVLATLVGVGAVTANPTYGIELSKQVFITIANVAMCIMLWDVYFDEELAQKGIRSILLDLSLVTVSSAFTAYITARGLTTLTNYFTTVLGVLGWGAAGLLASVVTGLLGVGWAFYCDDLYRHAKAS